MNRTIKLIAALLVAGIVFTGTNSLATIRYCNLDNAKSVESTNSCTAKNNYNYQVVVSHGTTSSSSTIIADLNEWNQFTKKYQYQDASWSVSKGTTKKFNPTCKNGYWAKLRMTASGSRGSGRGSISNEF